jgi:hypothetical protein
MLPFSRAKTFNFSLPENRSPVKTNSYAPLGKHFIFRLGLLLWFNTKDLSNLLSIKTTE